MEKWFGDIAEKIICCYAKIDCQLLDRFRFWGGTPSFPMGYGLLGKSIIPSNLRWGYTLFIAQSLEYIKKCQKFAPHSLCKREKRQLLY